MVNNCVNLNHPEFKELLKNSNTNPLILASKIKSYWDKTNNIDRFPTLNELGFINIKPGVSELFESNPELASAVYEVLGSKQDIEGFKEFVNKDDSNIELQKENAFEEAKKIINDNTELSIDEFKKLASKFSKMFNVRYSIISNDEFLTLTKGIKGSGAYVNSKGHIYFNQDNLKSDTVFHEFAHPFITAVKNKNKKLYNSLLKEIEENEPDIIKTIKNNYTGEQVESEIIVTALGKYARDRYFEKKSLADKIQEFYKTVTEYIKRLVGKKIDIAEITPETTLKDIADLFIEGIENNTNIEVLSPELIKKRDTVLKYKNVLQKRIEKLQNTLNRLPKNKKVINELITLKNQKEYYDYANEFISYINNANKNINSMYNFFSNADNITNPRYAEILAETRNYIDSSKGLIVPNIFDDEITIKFINNLNNDLTALEILLSDAEDKFVENLVKQYSNRNLTDDEIKQAIIKRVDLNEGDTWVSDLDSVPDIVLSNIVKKYKIQKETASRNVKNFTEKLSTLIDNLKSLGEENTDFIYEKINGKLTGNYLDKISANFKKTLEDANNALKEVVDGKEVYKQYIHITDYKKASKKDLKYNIDLKNLKDIKKELNKAEDISTGKPKDGEFFRYNNKFKNQRNIYEKLDNSENFWKWVKKDFSDLSESEKNRFNNSEEVYKKHQQLYYNTYYNEEIEVLVAVATNIDGKYRHIGETEYRNMRFPKPEFVEYNYDNSAILSDEYLKLLKPDKLSKAKKELYDFLLDPDKGEYIKALKTLPYKIEKDMMGRVPVIKSDDVKEFTAKGILMSGLDAVKSFFVPRKKVGSYVTDENGLITNQLSVYFVGSLKNQKVIDSIKKKIEDVKSSASESLSVKSAKLKQLAYELQKEESKPEAIELETDLLKSMSMFKAMAENHNFRQELEADINIVKEFIINKNLYLRDNKQPDGLKRDDSGKYILKQGSSSNGLKRFNSWIDMTFYGTKEEQFGKDVATALLRYNSLLGQGFNIFGTVNNYIMSRINNSIEAIGQLHYSKQSADKAVKMFNTDYLANSWKAINQNINSTLNVAGIKTVKVKTRNYSKYEALVSEFNMIDSLFGKDVEFNSLLDLAYMFENGVEYQAQSKVGMSLLFDTKIKNKITGEELSIPDAYEYDDSTGKIKLKKGFELSENEIVKLSLKIKGINKTIHGNYSQDDKTMLQKHWLGELAMQYHKWIYPSYKSRFGSRQFNEETGITTEGRYITAWNLAKYIAYNVKSLEDVYSGKIFKESYESLNPMEIANMKKNAVELAYFIGSFVAYTIFKGLAEGLDDDDKELKKFINFLSYQSNRQMDELITFVPILGFSQQYETIKNPIPLVRTFKEFGEVFTVGVKSAYYVSTNENDKLYFQKGVNKGDLKIAKEIRDITPVARLLNRWKSFENLQEFFIR